MADERPWHPSFLISRVARTTCCPGPPRPRPADKKPAPAFQKPIMFITTPSIRPSVVRPAPRIDPTPRIAFLCASSFASGAPGRPSRPGHPVSSDSGACIHRARLTFSSRFRAPPWNGEEVGEPSGHVQRAPTPCLRRRNHSPFFSFQGSALERATASTLCLDPFSLHRSLSSESPVRPSPAALLPSSFRTHHSSFSSLDILSRAG
jgi:hypothetical protein